MKNKVAWRLLAGGIGCLALYLIVVFNSENSFFILLLLFSSIVLNVVAVNIFITKGRKHRDDEDDD